MNIRQQNTVNMMNLVITVCENALAIVTAIPELLTSFTSFKSIVALIISTAKEQSIELSGIATLKTSIKTSLARSAALVAAAVKAYAHKNKMYDLEKEMSFTEKTLSKFNDLNIQKTAAHILDEANLHAADIIPFGITAADIAKLTTDLDTYAKRYNDPTIAIELRKHHTAKIDNLIAQANAVLHKEMDPLMLVVSATEPDFYDIYKNARNIIDRHGKYNEHKTAEGNGSISVIATATIDGSLLESVKADLIQNSVIIDTLFTDENGEVLFEDVKTGTYIIELTQETFNPKQSDEFTIAPDDELTIELSLDASLE